VPIVVASSAVAAVALVAASGLVVRAWRARRCRARRRERWAADAIEFSDEALSIVQLVLTWAVHRRSATATEQHGSLSPMVQRQFAALSAAAVELHEGAPSWATRSAVQHARRCLAALEQEVARAATRRRIRADAIGDPAPRDDRSALLYERVDELSYAARFLSIVACEDGDDAFR
jgi:hypothetical protein